MIHWTERRKEIGTAWLFLLPSLIGMAIFMIIPIVSSMVLSFYKWDLISPMEFHGLGNYGNIVKDEMFLKSLLNTLYYAAGTIPLSMVLALVAALLLNHKLKGMSFFRTVYFLPVISSHVAIALVWRWIYNRDYGMINAILKWLHIPGPDWLGDPAWAMPAVILMSVWAMMGTQIVLFLAGLQGIPADMYESADLDGATGWQRFRYITFPFLSPTTFFILIITLIGAFQVFDQAFIMTEGGPDNATLTVVFYLYNHGFKYFDMGYASSVAWILFLLIMIVTLVQWYVTQRKVFYN